MSVSADFKRDVQERKLTGVYSALSRYMSLNDGFRTFKDSLRYAYHILSEQLFKANDTIAYPVSENTESWDETYLGTQTAMLVDNFSRERVEHVMKVIAYQRGVQHIVSVSEILNEPISVYTESQTMHDSQRPLGSKPRGTVLRAPWEDQQSLQQAPIPLPSPSINPNDVKRAYGASSCEISHKTTEDAAVPYESPDDESGCPQILLDALNGTSKELIRSIICAHIMMNSSNLDDMLRLVKTRQPDMFINGRSGGCIQNPDYWNEDYLAKQIGLLMLGDFSERRIKHVRDVYNYCYFSEDDDDRHHAYRTAGTDAYDSIMGSLVKGAKGVLDSLIGATDDE